MFFFQTFREANFKTNQKIEISSNVDLSGKQQHGFKKSKSSNTLGLQIQSIIARALAESNYVLMASVDRSAAFDVVNIDLLIDRLKITGLLQDIVELIRCWLKNRSFNVEVHGLNSMFYDINSGTIQGSILVQSCTQFMYPHLSISHTFQTSLMTISQ